MHLERVRRCATDAGDAGSVMLEQIEDLAGIPCGLSGRRRHALEEELAPPLPIPGEPHLLQQVVIAFAVSLEGRVDVSDARTVGEALPEAQAGTAERVNDKRVERFYRLEQRFIRPSLTRSARCVASRGKPRQAAGGPHG